MNHTYIHCGRQQSCIMGIVRATSHAFHSFFESSLHLMSCPSNFPRPRPFYPGTMPAPVVIRDTDPEWRSKPPETLIELANGTVSTSLESFISFSEVATTRREIRKILLVFHNMTVTTDMNDISTSPRSLEYVFSSISSVVSMISSTIFHRRGISDVATSNLDYYGESIGAQLFTAEEWR